MKKFVLDTNLFFNMEAGLGLGSKTEEVVRAMTEGMRRLKESGTHEFYTPPRIMEEFLSFFEDKTQEFLQEFQHEVITKAPHANELQVAAPVLYQMVDEARSRNYRGAAVAEEEIQKAGRAMAQAHDLSKKDFEMTIGPVIKNFRDRYRQTTRFGFLDSVADLDIIMLARELDGVIVSSDEGVIRWGRIFGVREMGVPAFGSMLKG